MPRPLATLLLLVGTFGVMVAATLYWLDGALLDQARFQEAAVTALEGQTGRELVAQEVWTQLSVALPAVRVVNTDTAQGVIANFLARPSVDPLFARSAELIYQSLMTPGSGPVTFDLGQEYPLVIESLLGINAGIVGRLLPLDRLGAIVLVPEGELPDLSGLRDTVPVAAPVVAGVALVMVAAGLWLGRRRRWTLAVLGLSSVAAGLVQMALIPQLRDRLMASVTDPQVITMMNQVMDALEQPLVRQYWLFLLAGAGLVVVNVFLAGGARLVRRS